MSNLAQLQGQFYGSGARDARLEWELQAKELLFLLLFIGIDGLLTDNIIN